ncbi:MAG: ACP S-malonyltransferase [Verrucomicrobiae bacterium]|nr:ACP S-malonyltransferase [Verrucomicrobiae bacterium]
MSSSSSSKRVVLLFAGQGAQSVGMGRDLAGAFPDAAERFRQADEIFGFSLTGAMFDGPQEELTRTSRCQPALYVHGLVCLDLIKARVPNLEVAGAAGLSLGEFTAHAAAGTFDFETGLRLVAKRGLFMEEATSATEGSMAAMIGGEEEAVRRVAEECDVDVANFNAPGQIVISGTKAGITKALEISKENGIRIAKELDVAGAYHSRLMQSAQDKLATELAEVTLAEPTVPVICNFEARAVSEPDDIRRTLEAQVTGSVRWAESMAAFIDQGETTFLELGPGGVLAGLMKRIDRAAKVISVEDVASLEAAVEALNA